MTQAINWNRISDPIDKQVWEKLTSQFWIDTKIPVSNDLDSWRKMTETEKEVVRKVFASLTLMDTLQGNVGAPTLQQYADTPHAEAVFSNIAFMEHVHAKSYSTIFSTLCSTEEIDRLFRWAQDDDLLQEQVNTIEKRYVNHEPAVKFGACVLLESLLFYTGFYAPLRFASEGKITNTADIIRLIMRDEGVHGYYTGYKFQQMNPSKNAVSTIRSLATTLVHREVKRAEQLYDDIGWTEDVRKFIYYNANKAMSNMGLDPLFLAKDTQIPAYILSSLDTTGETHDFFSGAGASYVIGETEETTEEDWAWD